MPETEQGQGQDTRPIDSMTPDPVLTTPGIPPTQVDVSQATTPAIEQAKKGIVPTGDVLDLVRPVTQTEAKFVPLDPNSVYAQYVQPDLSWVDGLQFSTMEQALIIKALLENQYPGSVLRVEDNVNIWVFPPFRKLVYAEENVGGMNDQRVYVLRGFLQLADGGYPVEQNVGWCIKVGKNINHGSTAMEVPGWPLGNTCLRAQNEMGLATPIWVGGDRK